MSKTVFSLSNNSFDASLNAPQVVSELHGVATQASQEEILSKLDILLTPKQKKTTSAAIVGLDLFKVLYRDQQHEELFRIWLLAQYALLDEPAIKENFKELLLELQPSLKERVIQRMTQEMLEVRAELSRKNSYISF